MQKIKINKKISIFQIKDRDLFTTLSQVVFHAIFQAVFSQLNWHPLIQKNVLSFRALRHALFTALLGSW